MSNLQDKVKEQAEKIEELEKKSCKSNRQKRDVSGIHTIPQIAYSKKKNAIKEIAAKRIAIAQKKPGVTVTNI